MKLKTFLILLAAVIGVFTSLALLEPWGEPVPQDQLGLVIDSITFNNGANAYMKAADDQAALKVLPNAAGPQAALTNAKKVELSIDPNHIHVVRGKRLPTNYSMNPSISVFKFDLGLQQFTYSSKASYDCPTPNQIEADCVGGHVAFDINLQFEINRTIEDAQLGVELFHFIHDQRLQNQRGHEHILEAWSEQMLHTFVGTLMKSHIAKMQLYDVIWDKEATSKFLLDSLNTRYNQYGIIFHTAAITSAIRPPADQQIRIDNLVMKEYQNAALQLREEKYMPVLTQMQVVDANGRQKIQDEHNRGESVSINVIAEANKNRRDTFNRLVGPENYVMLEQWLTMNKALVSGGNTTVVVLPRSLQYADGLGKLPRPTKSEGDEHIFGVTSKQRTSTAMDATPATATPSTRVGR